MRDRAPTHLEELLSVSGMTIPKSAPVSLWRVLLKKLLSVQREIWRERAWKKYYSSLRSPAAASHSLTQNLMSTIENFLKLHKNENNIKMIVQSVISSIAKSYEITVEKVESDNAIVTSAKKYLYGLRRFGANSTATQSTIDTILTSLATSHYSNYFIAEILGVPNKRVAKAKIRRAEFDKFVQSQIDSLPEVGNNINQLVQDDSESTNTIASSTDSKTSSVDESNWQDSDDVGDIPSEPQLCNTDKPSQIKRKKMYSMRI